MKEREIERDKRRVLEYLKEARKFMPYLHEGRSVAGIEKLIGNRDRAWRAILALVQDRKVEYEVNCSPDYVRAYADIPPAPSPIVADVIGESKTPLADELREAFAGGDRIARVRAAIAPRPKLHYPAPWRAAETNGDGRVVVVCADGHYTCEAATRDAAEAIVLAVNALAGVAE
jgi:hypothetical protein